MTKSEIYKSIKDVEYQFIIDYNYTKKEFKFKVNENFDIVKHNKTNSDLIQYLLENQYKSFSFITAQNPFYDLLNNQKITNKKLQDKNNLELNEKLKLDLSGLKYFEAETIFENKIDETGFVVFDLPISLLLILKNKYSQNAVIFGNNKYIKLII